MIAAVAATPAATAIAAAVAAAYAAVAAAAAAQQDDDENDPQAAAVVPVVPHVLFHLTYQSETYYEGGRADAAWPRKIFRPAHRAKPHRKKGLNP